jgi:hypothetical protein
VAHEGIRYSQQVVRFSGRADRRHQCILLSSLHHQCVRLWLISFSRIPPENYYVFHRPVTVVQQRSGQKMNHLIRERLLSNKAHMSAANCHKSRSTASSKPFALHVASLFLVCNG